MKLRKTIKKNPFLNKIFRIPYETINKVKFSFLESWMKNIGVPNGKKRLKLLSKKDSNNLIVRMIESKKPFMIARYGGTEFSVMLKLGNEKYENNNLHMVAGVFPKEDKIINKFRKCYLEESKKCDVLSMWLYKRYFFKKKKLIKDLPNLNNLIDIDSLNPLENNWIKSLEGKRVLVVHPFKKSIESQYKRRDKIPIIPHFKRLEIIQAVQSAGEEENKFNNWFEALEYMKKEINKKKDLFDIAIIGCGAYGLPLASHVKNIGKQAMHLAGVTQLLFGIKGKRWENQGVKFPENWIYPLEEDTPKKVKEIEKLEGGCYW